MTAAVDASSQDRPPGRLRGSLVISVLGVILLIGVALSSLASSAPDGLESAVINAACDGDQDCPAEAAGAAVYDAAPLEDYRLTPLSGLVGTLAVFALGSGVAVALARRRRPPTTPGS